MSTSTYHTHHIKFMVDPAGVEPAMACLQGKCLPVQPQAHELSISSLYALR